MKQKARLFLAILAPLLILWAIYALVDEEWKRTNYLLIFLIAGLAFAIAFLLYSQEYHSSTRHRISNQKGRNWIIISLVVVFAGLGIWMVMDNMQLRGQIKQMESLHALQKLEMERNLRQNNLQAMMGNLLNKIDLDLEKAEGKKLPESTIQRISDFTRSIDPAEIHQLDSLPDEMLSFERGQLLMALSRIQMDSASFARIREESDFSGADLRNMDLAGLDLSGIRLAKANLMNADLRGSILRDANLAKANFRGSNLEKANLSGANMKRAQMDWANLNYAHVSRAALDGVNLNGAQMRKAVFDQSSMTFARLENAFLENASLKYVDLTGTKMNTSVLENADLTGAILNWLELQFANLDGVRFNKAYVNVEDWLSVLQDQETIPPFNYVEHYTLVPDSMAHNQFVKFRIEQIQ